MPTHYIGRKSYNNGKKLLDILLRLKDMGRGRIVYRQHFITQYPEPSYHIITEVKPYMRDPCGKIPDENIQTQVRSKKVWRGEDWGDSYVDSHWKEDWRLVPKNEEHLWTNHELKPKTIHTLPEHVPLPPLLEYVFKQRMPEGAELPKIQVFARGNAPKANEA